MDPFTVGMIVVIASIVSATGTALVVSNRIKARHKREMLGAGEDQKLLVGSETPELVRKLNQLAAEQREKCDQLLETKVDAVLNNILEISGRKYFETSIEKLFPDIGKRMPKNEMFEYALRGMASSLRSKGLTVEIPYEGCPQYNVHNPFGEIKVTW